jgi:8-oxo-dGTP pyrophosphatase MutT (NUDIX family)
MNFEFKRKATFLVEFNATISYLIQRIKSPLPGREAHRRSLPRDRVSQRLNVEEAINPRLGGVLILLYPDLQGQTFFTLIQRPQYQGAHGGQISFPGGKFEEQDQSIIKTALRETYEEIGVDPSSINIIGRISDIYIPPSNFRVTPVIGFTSSRPAFVRDPFEVDEVLEIPLVSLLDRQFHKAKDIHVRGIILPDTPYYDLQDRVVWGATAMILSELIQILEEAHQA